MLKHTFAVLSLILIGMAAALYSGVVLPVHALASDHFVTTWKTDNPGSSNSTSITIPTYSGAGYSYQVDWNNDQDFLDAGETTLNTGDVTHNFGVAGTYTIRITGTFPRIYFGNTGDDENKILRVDQWGTNPWTTMELAFTSTPNLRITATDKPNLSNVTSFWAIFAGSGITNNAAMRDWDTSHVTRMDYAFNLASNFNEDISGWNIGNVTSMYVAFNGTSSFNQNLASWNMTNVTNATLMLDNSGISPDNYASSLIGWSSQNLQNNIVLTVSNRAYCSNASAARAHLASTFGWSVIDGGVTENCNHGDTDHDGIINMDEDLSGGDANGDSIADKTQSNVMNAYNSVSQGNVTLVSTNQNCVFRNGLDVYDESTLSTQYQDQSYNYPLGLLSFKLECTTPGVTTSVKVIYDKVYDTTNALLRKNKSGSGFGNVEGNAVFTVENINGVDRTVATYSLQDGGANDDDGTTNTFILDPVGLANPIPKTTLPDTGINIFNIETMSILTLVTAVIVGGGALWFTTKRKSV